MQLTTRRYHTALIYGAVCFTLAILVHKFFRFIDSAPYVAIDDGLANISVFLANAGRYGLPVSPYEIGGGIRLDSMLNYGPPTFLMGAALDWLFGSSYAVLRGINPLCLALLIALALVTFRTTAIAAAGVFSAGLVYVFWTAQWPMFRPDVVTSLLIVATIACASLALRAQHWWLWSLTGLAAATAAANHQVAWAVIPASMVVLLASLRRFDQPPRSTLHHVRIFLAFAAGAAAGALLYLVAIGFRVFEVIALWKAYASITSASQEGERLGFGGVLAKHLMMAWGQVPWSVTIAIYALCAAGAALAATLQRLPAQARHQAWALLVPPLVVGLAYHLSLGLYTNFHTGYVIPVQATALWTASATVAVLIVIASALANSAALPQTVASIVAATLVVTVGIASFRQQPWEQRAAANVRFSAYYAKVMDEIPENAKVFGDLIFGLEAGTRYNYLYAPDGLSLLREVKPSDRSRFVPEFLVLNRYLDELVLGSFGGNDWRPGAGVVPGLVGATTEWPAQYSLTSLVDAPPYGTTRIYQTSAPDQVPDLPSVAAYLPQDKRWLGRLGRPVSIEAREVEPAKFQLSFSRSVATAIAARSFRLELPAGIFLITAALPDGVAADAHLDPCFVTATATARIEARLGDLGFGFPLSPCFPGERQAHLLVRHAEGELVVSLLRHGSPEGFRIVGVRPMLANSPEGVPLPPLAEWTTIAEGGETRLTDGTLKVLGDRSRSGYQLLSPPIPVPKNAAGIIAVELDSEHGDIAVGVVGESDRKWLSDPQRSGSVSFNTESSEYIRVVVINTNATALEKPAEFRIRSGKLVLGETGKGNYVYELAACVRRTVQPKPRHCVGSGN